MKSEDLLKLILSMYEKDEDLPEIFQWCILCLRTVKRCCTMICESDFIELSTFPGRSPIMKDRLNRKKKVTSRKLAVQLNISRIRVCRILKNDLFL